MNTSTELVESCRRQVPLYLKNIIMIACFLDTVICEAALSQSDICSIFQTFGKRSLFGLKHPFCQAQTWLEMS